MKKDLEHDIVDDFVLKDAIDGGKKLIKYTGDRGKVLLPDELEITEIEDCAFLYNNNITKVKSNTVKKVGNNVFKCCKILKTVFFPNIETTGVNVFFSCYSLEDVFFPKLKTIKSSVFSECHNLESVFFPNVKIIEKGAFWRCYNLESVFFP